MGPKRTGLLYVRRDHLDTLAPTVVGAYSDRSNSLRDRELTLRSDAQKYEYGTQNAALIYGLESALDLVSALGLPAIWNHNRSLAEACRDGLRDLPGVRLLSPDDALSRSAILTFRIEGRDNRQVANTLTGRRLRVRSVTEAGLDAVRASFHVCNSEAETARLIASVKEVAATRPDQD